MDDLRRRSGLRLSDFLDAVALCTARKFAAGYLSYDQGDIAANGLWSAWWRTIPHSDSWPPSLIVHIPDLLSEVYFAFDDGEYPRDGDPPGTDTGEKYTRPQIEAIVAKYDTA